MGFPLDSLLRGLASRWIVSDSLDQADAIVVLGGGLDIRLSLSQTLSGLAVDRESGDAVVSWSRLSEQNLRVDKWSVCRG